MSKQATTSNSPSGPTEKNSPVLQELRELLSQPGPWPERFQRLAQAIAYVSSRQGITCEECSSAIDLYVARELATRDAGQVYPDVKRHLATCALCREEYELLYRAVSEKEEALFEVPIQATTVKLSFLQPKPEELPWTLAIQREPFLKLTFAFARSYLASLFSPPTLAATRAGPELAGQEISLLLSDYVEVGARRLVVEATVTGKPASSHFDVHVAVASSTDLPDRLEILLAWAGHEITVPLDENGRALLSDVPLGKLIDTDTNRLVGELILTVRQAEEGG